MAARLKVFSWSDGFHSWTVATSSRPKALVAWGVDQDLFKSGLAQEVEEGADHGAALASPGKVVKSGLAIDPEDIKPAKPDRDRAQRKAAKEREVELHAKLEALELKLQAQIAPLRQKRDVLAAEIAEREAQAETARAKLKRQVSR